MSQQCSLGHLIHYTSLLNAICVGGMHVDGYLDARVSDIMDCKDFFGVDNNCFIQYLAQKVMEKKGQKVVHIHAPLE